MIPFSKLDEAVGAVLPKALEGHGPSVQKLIDIIYPPVMSYTRSRMSVNSYPTIEDVVQETCLAVAKILPKYEDQGKPFMALVYKIAANKIIDARRSAQRDQTNSTDTVEDSVDSASNHTLSGAELSQSGEEKYLNKESCNEIEQLLDNLNDKQREVISLRIFGGYSAEETAEIVGISAGAVRVTQHRALAKLRENFSEVDFSDSILRRGGDHVTEQ